MKKHGLLAVPFIVVLLGLSVLVSNSSAVASNYRGVYTGTFEGIDKGHWVVNVNSNGTCYMGTWSDVHQTAEYVIDKINENGIVYYQWSNGDYIYFEVHSDGSAYGQNGNAFYDNVYSYGTGHKNDPAKVAAYTGNYEGDYSGDVSGTIYAVVHEDGSVSGSASMEGSGKNTLGVGSVTGNGEMFAVAEDNTVFYGKIDSKGKLTGDWNNYYYNNNGTLSAVREGSPAADGGGGGGGGGCFIHMLK